MSHRPTRPLLCRDRWGGRLFGKRSPAELELRLQGMGNGHQIPEQFIFKPSNKALQEYSQATEPAHSRGFFPLETQKEPMLPLLVRGF